MNYFPDGQLNFESKYKQGTQNITCRLSTWADFQYMLAEAAYQKKLGQTVSLYSPYVIGSRSDREFSEYGINYLKSVISPLINQQNFRYVKILDGHSLALHGAIDRLVDDSPISNIMRAINDIGVDQISIISPDFGAYKKVWGICQEINRLTSGTIDIDFVSCEKIRSLSGEILHTKVSHTPKFQNTIIIDDICDGGRTFVEISKALTGYTGRLFLWVTHGIFSKGLEELTTHFDHIYTTNSIQDINSEMEFGKSNKIYLKKLTQYKVI